MEPTVSLLISYLRQLIIKFLNHQLFGICSMKLWADLSDLVGNLCNLFNAESSVCWSSVLLNTTFSRLGLNFTFHQQSSCLQFKRVWLDLRFESTSSSQHILPFHYTYIFFATHSCCVTIFEEEQRFHPDQDVESKVWPHDAGEIHGCTRQYTEYLAHRTTSPGAVSLSLSLCLLVAN